VSLVSAYAHEAKLTGFLLVFGGFFCFVFCLFCFFLAYFSEIFNVLINLPTPVVLCSVELFYDTVFFKCMYMKNRIIIIYM
jgi:hypothetical protein